jgi:hypothetical protein
MVLPELIETLFNLLENAACSSPQTRAWFPADVLRQKPRRVCVMRATKEGQSRKPSRRTAAEQLALSDMLLPTPQNQPHQ